MNLKNIFYLHKSVARSVANWVRMVGTVGTLHGYGTQYLTYVPKCRTYVPMYRTMRTLFTVPVLLSKPYLKKVANRALLLKIDNIYIFILKKLTTRHQTILYLFGTCNPQCIGVKTMQVQAAMDVKTRPSRLGLSTCFWKRAPLSSTRSDQLVKSRCPKRDFRKWGYPKNGLKGKCF